MRPYPATAFLRPLRRGLLNVRRSRGTFFGVAALFGVVLIAQAFLALGLGTQVFAVRSEFSIPLLTRATDREVQQFFASARQLPGVSSVEYVPREKAMELERAAHPEVVTLLESDALNPFNDTAIIMLTGLSAYDEFAAFVQHPYWNNTVDPAAFAAIAAQREEQLSALQQARWTGSVAFLLLGLASVALFLVVLELTCRSALGRQQDLFVERISGAEELSITLPFAVEAVVLLSIALLLSLVCAALAAYALPSSLPVLAEAKRLIAANTPALIVAEIIAVLLMGCVGAVLGIKRVHSSPHGTLAFI
ncbi:MAG: hypothetical protein HOO67_07850 [Candidatus Peribacteraceae bacterium]|nr:hypothetical protein [Candidatus Peribacteraceae bacterium]